MIRSEEQWSLNGSQLNNLAVRNALQRRGTLIMNRPGGSPGHEESNSIFPYTSPGEGNGNPLHCCCLENFMDRGAWQVTVCGITKSWTQMSD